MAKYKAKVNTKEVDTNKKVKKVDAKKPKAIKNKKMLTEEQTEVRRFIIILILVIAIIVGLYFLSTSVVNKRKNADETETKEVEISYSKATVGTILNRPYDEYYVLVYNSSDTKAQYYSSLITNYNRQDALKIYFVDLDNPRNASYIAKNGESNPYVTTDVTEFAFGPLTLLYITDGTVYGYYEDLDTIKAELNI